MPSSGFLCDECGAKFSRRFTLKRHKERKHSELPEYFPCDICHQVFRDKNQYDKHIEIHRPTRKFKETQRSLGLLSLYEKVLQCDNLDACFSHKKSIEEVLQYELQKKNVIKASIDVTATRRLLLHRWML